MLNDKKLLPKISFAAIRSTLAPSEIEGLAGEIDG